MKRIWIWLAAFVGAAYGGWLWFRPAAPAEVELASVSRAAFPISFVAEGFVLGKTYDLSPEVSGRVAAVEVEEGAQTHPGQPVLRIDASDLEASLEQAIAAQSTATASLAEVETAYRAEMASVRSSMEVARANVRRAQSELARVLRGTRPEQIDEAIHFAQQMEAQAAEARRKRDRAEALYGEGAIPLAQREASQAAYESALAQLEMARSALRDRQAGPLAEDVRSAKAAVEIANSQVRQASAAELEAQARRKASDTARARIREADAQIARTRAALLKYVLRSPVAGTIVRRLAEPGTMASPGQTVLRIATREDLRVEAEIRSEDMDAVSLGMPVQISLPSQTGRFVAGKLVLLASAAEAKPDAAIRTRILRARIRILESSERLVPGLEVDVRGVRQGVSVLSIPSDAIDIEGDEASAFVYGNGRVHRKAVKIGRANADRTEVLSGLKEGDRAVVSGKEGLQDGQKVSVADGRRR